MTAWPAGEPPSPPALSSCFLELTQHTHSSGCITSAESVLITLQSHTEVLTFLAANAALSRGDAQRRIPVISIAPQSLASLAAALNASAASSSSRKQGVVAEVTSREVLRRVQAFCADVLGFEYVFDTTFARHLVLREHTAEFLERRKASASAKEGGEGESSLPMLASACPGWICYAEKAHPEMLPFISRTKSPQQVMGTLVKSWMGSKWGRTPDGVYHVSVMPCYDKKLEASRKDFYDEVYATRDVDCVITTGELELLMREKGWDLSMPVPGELDGTRCSPSDKEIATQPELPELLQHPGTSSGSYLHSIIEHLKASSETRLTLSVKMIRNGDYEEYTLTGSDGGTVFKGAKCYGFRNLQNIVRKVGRERGVRTGAGAAGRLGGRVGGRRNALRGGGGADEEGRKYDYVEVMACPGGCVNGGGQLKAVGDTGGQERDWKWGDKEWTKRVEETYWGEQNVETRPTKTLEELAERVVEELCGSDVSVRQRMLRTGYRAVESEVVGLAVKW
ncbi:iron hydrogenase [Pholiota conissans]|uniref:Iron hydrogenase n=1 Tax=Pholiota conissans TaxID=109636 RepID=A0A9P5YXA0_9AGAR|nr:iron hydrogenase [Pholiota conissans]